MRRGLSVAILAPDGAGKTSLADAIADAWKPVYAGVARFHFLDEADGRTPVTDPHGQPLRSRLSSYLKLFYYLAKVHFHRQPKLSRLIQRGYLVILDRDLPDVAADSKRYRLNLPPRALDLFIRLAPRPDVTLILLASPEAILARSSELSPDTLRVLFSKYSKLSTRLEKAFAIDANQPLEGVVQQSLDIIAWKCGLGSRMPGHRSLGPQHSSTSNAMPKPHES